ncbi:hypothetical protein DB88DRAFT_239974 [Papiliotrema laurentii]|uniref:Glutaredoxin domain-containing protein n=1 Tax=Papiliotrema laurentii TaxID=5418 RepID=A0AAD9FRI1_PAPLA|nr:hypothetical protein DB88DRAFT_239974 [Papiliotrema laurentii]
MRPNLPPLDTVANRMDYFNPNFPTSPSPLSRPPFLPDTSSDEVSPTPTALMTPTTEDCGGEYDPRSLATAGNLKSDHSALAALALTAPGSEASSDGPFPPLRRSLPLLPPNHPLRQKLHAAVDDAAYDKTAKRLAAKTFEEGRYQGTPETRPFSSTTKVHASELSTTHWQKPKMFPVASPYPKSSQRFSLTSSGVSRSLRPLVLLVFCLAVYGFVWITYAVKDESQLKTFSFNQAEALSRRQAEMQRNRELSRQALYAQMAEAGIQSTANTDPVKFRDTSEELAALINFVTSTTANALPDLDPSHPLDPATVLDFDPSRSGAREDLDLLIHEVDTIYPIVLFGKMRDPWHREMKRMLAEYKITPSPLIIDVDQRRDHRIFLPLIARLLGTAELPQLILNRKTLGSYHELLELRDKGEFGTLLEDGGVMVREASKKKKGVKEHERIENERILGPAPIQDV